MASYPSTSPLSRDSDSGVLAKVAALFLGVLVAVLGLLALLAWADAREAREDAQAAAAEVKAGAAVQAEHATALPLESFAGKVAPNAEALAEAHRPTTPRCLRCRRATW